MKKYINLDNLPRKGKKFIDWNNSIGITVGFIYGNIEDNVKIVEYNKDSQKISFVYNNKIFSMTTGHFSECKFGKILKYYSYDYKYHIGEIVNELKITGYNLDSKSNSKKYTYECIKCGYKGIRDKYKFENGVDACPLCKNKITLYGYNDISSTDSWMVDYFYDKNDAFSNSSKSNKKVEMICPICHTRKKYYINNLYYRGYSCPKCSDGISAIEKFTYAALECLKENSQILDFDRQVFYEWNTYLTPDRKEHKSYIDFVITTNDNRKIPIETDGEFHRNNNLFTGDSVVIQKNIDIQRDINCLKNLNEKTIRISNNGNYKENILNSELKNIVNLDCINWEKCYKYTSTSMIKHVSKLYEYGFCISDISRETGYHRTSILRWLKKGTKLSICNYVPKENLFQKKKISMFIDGNYYRTYNCANDIVEDALNVFNINMKQKSISHCAINGLTYKKRYSFLYL